MRLVAPDGRLEHDPIATQALSLLFHRQRERTPYSAPPRPLRHRQHGQPADRGILHEHRIDLRYSDTDRLAIEIGDEQDLPVPVELFHTAARFVYRGRVSELTDELSDERRVSLARLSYLCRHHG